MSDFDLNYLHEIIPALTCQNNIHISHKTVWNKKIFLLRVDFDLEKTERTNQTLNFEVSILSTSQLHRAKRLELQCRAPIGSPAKYRCTARATLDQQHEHIYLSLPGIPKILTVKFTGVNSSFSGYFLRSYWLPEMYPVLIDATRYPRFCEPVYFNYSHCIFFTSIVLFRSSYPVRHFIFFRKHHPCHESPLRFHDVAKSRLQMKTWTEASQLCQNASGFLPTFRSKKELLEMVSFVGIYLLPVEAFFIGIYTNEKVCL